MPTTVYCLVQETSKVFLSACRSFPASRRTTYCCFSQFTCRSFHHCHVFSLARLQKLTFLLLPFYLLLCGATVYIQAHYLIDALAGFGSAIFVLWLSSYLYQKRAAFSIVNLMPVVQSNHIRKVFSYLLIIISVKK